MVLKRDNETMPRHQLLLLGATHVRSLPQRDHGNQGRSVVLITERTLVQSLFGARKVFDCEGSFHCVCFAFTLS